MEKLELSLDEPERVYFSGDDVKGHVLVQLSSNIAVQAVAVKFVGEACVNVPDGLVEERGNKKRKNVTNKIVPISLDCGEGKPTGWLTENKTQPRQQKPSKTAKSYFSSKEKYFFHKEFLYGHKYSSYRENLWAGEHIFPFNFTLPSQLPSSFYGKFGYVRYYCESALLRWKLRDVRRMYFSVANVADINHEPKAESGSEEQKSTNSCFFCCPRGTIFASAELKRRGYASGEVAPLHVEIHNMSNARIRSHKATVIQAVGYFSSQGIRRFDDSRHVLEVSRGEVAPGSSATWGTSGLRLPPLPPTSFSADSCKIISIHYRIEVIISVVGEKEPLTLRLPIIVGNVPLKRHFSQLKSQEDLSNDGVTNPSLPRQLLLTYSSLPGVTSEVSINPEQSKCVYKLPQFRPRYLVYVPKF